MTTDGKFNRLMTVLSDAKDRAGNATGPEHEQTGKRERARYAEPEREIAPEEIHCLKYTLRAIAVQKFFCDVVGRGAH